MSDKIQIKYLTTECIVQSVEVLKEYGEEFNLQMDKDVVTDIFLLSTLGYVISNDEYKEEVINYFRQLAELLKESDNIINEAKYYAQITKS